jgi:hypothetical protein
MPATSGQGSTWLVALAIGDFGCFAGHQGLVLLGGQRVALAGGRGMPTVEGCYRVVLAM